MEVCCRRGGFDACSGDVIAACLTKSRLNANMRGMRVFTPTSCVNRIFEVGS
jgi:hypothetical protein